MGDVIIFGEKSLPSRNHVPTTAFSQTISPATEAPSNRRKAFAAAILSNAFCGVSATLLAVYLPDALRELAVDTISTPLVAAWLNAAPLLGWTFGGIILGWAGDRIGRARTFAISLGLLGITMLATAWASDWTTVVLYRLMTGAGIGGTMVLSAILVAETWPERSRAIALATLGIAFPVGIVSSGLLT
ncbi:MAG: MFS transporter, partial [Rhodothermales bacterium]